MGAYLKARLVRALGIYGWRWIKVSDRGRFTIGPRTYNWADGRITSHRDDLGILRCGVDGVWRLHVTIFGQRVVWPRPERVRR